jgi:hypothetical protein
MPKGFGQRYWIQVVHLDDTPDEWIPVNGGRTTALDAAALWLGQPNTDFVLVLDGRLPREALAQKHHMIAEFNRSTDDRAQDCRVYSIRTKKAKAALR